MKLFITLIVVAALGAGGWFFWKQWLPKQAGAQAASRTATATIQARNIQFAVSVAGDIGPADQVSVRPEVNGKIAELPVDIGDQVKKDALLCRLDDSDLRTERDARQTEIAGAKLLIEDTTLKLAKAQRDSDRNKELMASKLISQEVFDAQKTELDLAKNNVELSRNALDKAQQVLRQVEDRIAKTKLLAPFDCTVLTRPVSLGQTVSGSAGFNSGTEILSIANLNAMIINAHVNQVDVTRLKSGQDVDIKVESVPGLKMKGVVERIAPQAVIKNSIKGFAARISIKEIDSRIRPGMTAILSIPVASAENVLAVPLAAVFSEKGERYVFVKQDEEGKFERRAVIVGVADYSFAEVQSGLKDGEEVALELPAQERAAKTGPPVTKAFESGGKPGGGPRTSDRPPKKSIL